MKHILRLTITILILGFATLHAQEDANAKVDTALNTNEGEEINQIILNDYKRRVKNSEAKRISDSVKVAALEAQILALAASDDVKRKGFEDQLKELNNKGGQRLVAKKLGIDSLRANAKPYPVYGFFKDLTTLMEVISTLKFLAMIKRHF